MLSRFALRILFGMLVTGTALCATAAAQSAEDSFRDGLRAWFEGNSAEAQRQFDRALSQQPSNEEVARMRDLAGWDTIFRWHQGKAGDNLQRFAEYLVARQRTAATPDTATLDQIRQWVEVAVHQGRTIEQRFQAKVNLADKAGDQAVKFLQQYLADPSEDNNANAIEVCVHLSSEAVMPLLELMSATESRLRQNAAIALGRIRDIRAAPDLKFLVEQDKDTGVKRAAERALTMIYGNTAWHSLQSRQLFVERGEKFLLNHAAFIRNYDLDWAVWRLDPETQLLQKKQVRYWQYNELLAEESAYDAVQADVNNGPGWALVIATHLQQWREAGAHLAAASQAQRQDEVEALTALANEVHNKLVMAAPAGQYGIYGALERAVRFRKWEIALEALDLLERVATPDALPGVDSGFPTGDPSDAIILALQAEDKRVQYAAASALFRIAPQTTFYGMAPAMAALGRALQESGNRSVLVVVKDQGLKNQLVPIFERNHIVYRFAQGPKEGLQRAKNAPGDDLYLVDYEVLKSPTMSESFGRDRFVQNQTERVESERFYFAIMEDYRTKDTPIVVVCDSQDQASDAKANFERKPGIFGFVVPDEGGRIVPEEMVGILTSVWDQKNTEDPQKGARFAIHAAEVLSELPADSPHLQNRELVFGSLVTNATAAAEGQRSADVTIASMKALGKLIQKTQRAPDFALVQSTVLPALRKALKSEHLRATGGDTDVPSQRVIGWVAYALGEIYKVYGEQAFDKATYAALVENLQQLTDHEARQQIGLCIGKIPLGNKVELLQKLYRDNRWHGETNWE